MALKDDQTTALGNLKTLLSLATTGLRVVATEMPESIQPLPYLVLADRGLLETRAGQWRELEWDLELQVFVQIGKLTAAIKLARDIRADIIDRLGTDITLGGAVSRTAWKQPLRLTGLRWGNVDYAGVVGTYTLWMKEARAFA